MADALLNRNWYAFSGTFFEDFDSSMIIEPFRIEKGWTLIGSLDPGFSSPLSFGLKARDFEGNIYRIATYYEAKKSAGEHAPAILDFIKNNKFTGEYDKEGNFIKGSGRMPSVIVAGHDAWARRDRYSVIASDVTLEQVFAEHGLYLTKAVTDRKPGWWAMKSGMREHRYFVFDIYNKPFLEEMQAAISGDDPEDLKGKGNDPNISDHALDEDRYGTMEIYTPRQQQKMPELSDRDRAMNNAKIPSREELETEL
jgi:hypothetical protein